MLSRLNSEVSILPTGLGNHYTSSNKRLIPPDRRQFPYNHSVSRQSDCFVDDMNAPAANMSFRQQHETFGPDVLVIIGIVLACLGAILTLISFYCRFRHPAIQATMSGIGPSLVGIGMLFCILRLFFCSFCISKTCCECIGDGIQFTLLRCGCYKRKQKVKPLLQVKGVSTNGQIVHKPQSNGINHNRSGLTTAIRMEPIEEEIRGHRQTEEDVVRDEIDLLDQLEDSPDTNRNLHKNINELVLKSNSRY